MADARDTAKKKKAAEKKSGAKPSKPAAKAPEAKADQDHQEVTVCSTRLTIRSWRRTAFPKSATSAPLRV